jgi:triacylglycerol lipase
VAGACLGATGWAFGAWRAGHGSAAWLGAAVIVGLFTLTLALEFAMLRLTHGSDPAPRATTPQLLTAWWAEMLAAPVVFCWRQPFFSNQWPDNLPSEPATPVAGRGVLLVHGYVCNRGLWNRWLARLHAQGTPVVAVNLEPVFGSIDDYVEIVEKAVARLEHHTGLPPVVVAHSMGGLVVRRWWAMQPQVARIHRLITLGTPHRGTWLARLAFTSNARQMRLSSPWLLALAAQESSVTYERMSCFFSHCDNIVFPPSTATLPGACNVHLKSRAHVCLVDSPEPWAELQRCLQPVLFNR